MKKTLAILIISFTCGMSYAQHQVPLSSLGEDVVRNGCVDTTQNGGKQGKEVCERVCKIYKTICKAYNEAKDECPQDRATFDKSFCSDEWNRLMDECGKIDSRHPGELGALDYDYWIQGQDWDVVSFKNVEIIATKPDTVNVRLVLHNGTDNTIKLVMVRERGGWFIDDMSNFYSKNGIKQYLKDYIKTYK